MLYSYAIDISSIQLYPSVQWFDSQQKITSKKYIFLHISSSYAKILGETNFQPGRLPEVGKKQKTEKKEERKTESW